MPLILNLETSTKNCSVSLSEENEILAFTEESSDKYIHSEKLHLFIQGVMKEAGKLPVDLQAIAVGKGPGSYTGLRIGVSAAKGLCYALGLPLIAVDGLKILVSDFLETDQVGAKDVIIPMLDARRMEVYCSTYNAEGKRVSAVEARVIDKNSFAGLEADQIHLIGDGAAKLKEILDSDQFRFHDLKFPTAKALARLAVDSFKKNDFEDVAYFEPLYLKDFVAGKPKKML